MCPPSSSVASTTSSSVASRCSTSGWPTTPTPASSWGRGTTSPPGRAFRPAGFLLSELNLQWFDAHVRGIDSGADCVPQVTQYVRGVERWEQATTWPRPGLTAKRWHLRSDAGLTPEAPTGADAGRQYLQLPVTGVCTEAPTSG